MFMLDNKEEFLISVICEVLSVSRSGFYAWMRRLELRRKLIDYQNPRTKQEKTRLLAKIHRIHRTSGETYGSPRIHQVLKREGISCSVNHVARLMREDGICAKTKKRFKATTNSKHNLPVSPNLLLCNPNIPQRDSKPSRRDFSPMKPDKARAGDITYIWTKEGWLYLAVVIDLFSRSVVGWSMNKQMTSQLVVSALSMAVRRRRPQHKREKDHNSPSQKRCNPQQLPDLPTSSTSSISLTSSTSSISSQILSDPLIFHSDQGSQYASIQFQSLLARHSIRGSMSRKGNCWDNAVSESFFGSLKTELVAHQKYLTRSQARRSIFDYIECFYNRRRLHSTLGYKSPSEYELAYHETYEQSELVCRKHSELVCSELICDKSTYNKPRYSKSASTSL